MKRHLLVIATAVLAAAAVRSGRRSEVRRLRRPGGLRAAQNAGRRVGSRHRHGQGPLSYELIAGGTSLVERESGEKMPAMMTVYYLDGDRLLLTHYCMAGNQPRMQARAFNPETGEVAFEFLDATNLTPGAGHMHNATFHLADNDHFSSQWEFYENGQRKMAETAQYTRVQ